MSSDIRRIVPQLIAVSVTSLLVLSATPSAVIAAGVVGDGTPASCTEAAYDAALVGGGDITFNCGAAPVTIALSHRTVLDGWAGKIDGEGLVTLDGNYATGLFSVQKGSKLELERLTLTRAGGGVGAIYNAGKLTISDCTFSANIADSGGGAIGNRGNLKVTDSLFDDNHTPSVLGGGAIEQYKSKAVITNTTFSNNSLHAIHGVGAKMKLINCTFSGNSGGTEPGGAIFAGGSKIKISNCTFSGNSAQDGGAIFAVGTMGISSSTFVDNTADIQGGAISLGGGKMSFKATLFADNTPGHCYAYAGEWVDKGYNLTDSSGCGLSADKGSLIGVDPILSGGLANNGGPTQTIALDSASPAKNVARCVKTDQRGYVRPGAGADRCTIGAYEVDSPGCSSKLSACGSPAFCINLLKDINNCGACGNACAGGLECVAGQCE